MSAVPEAPGQLALGSGMGEATGETERSAGTASGRSTAARLARLHVRTGARALARAELETMAGRGELDGEALADLAEVRWRTGDLPGAGEAAQAHLLDGGTAPVAYVVAVEALAATGRPREARQLATRFLSRPGIDEAILVALFAGRPRSAVWPSAASGGAEGAMSTSASPGAATAPAPVPSAMAVTVFAPSATPAEKIDAAGVEAAIARGELALAAARLAAFVRAEPSLAPLAVSLADRALARVGERGPTVAQLHLVRGDAFRLLGREHEAAAAFHRARRALTAPAEHEDAP
ncbi:MAG TPA: hypothetical protein VK592_07675 [Candidatus Dormibacteraeota bacterium]|nr:hypothetical protein [Candidatus Dormibacteraeota bacterium]